MAADRMESDPVLVRILAKVAAWQAAADSYRAALALEQAGDTEIGTGHAPRTAIELPVGAFRGMKIPEAIKLFLQATRRKQTVREIATGLREGGLETAAKNFETTVAGALHRLKVDGQVLRFKDGWDLAEAHSTALRNRLTKDTPKAPPAKRKSKAAGKVKRTKGKKLADKKPAAPRGPSLDERIQAYLAAHPMDWFTPQQVSEALHETNASAVNLAFARLVRYKKIARNDGRYAAAKGK